MRRMLVAVVGLSLLIPGPAQAVTKDVEVRDNAFDPRRTRVVTGGSVRWMRAAGSVNPHNVREDGGLFRSGAPTSGAIDFTVAFSAGTFHYYCEVHGSPSGGMDGLVRVPVKIKPAPAGPPFRVIWATKGSETGSRYDVKYRAGDGPWKRWKRNASGKRAVFGKKGRPERVSTGVTYSFRARSKEGAARSRWSPKRSFTA